MTDTDSYPSVISEVLALYPAADTGAFLPRYAPIAPVAHGWYMRCARTVLAILALDREGLTAEASPLRRTLIEHALGIAWLRAEGGALTHSLVRRHAKDASDRLHAVTVAGWETVEVETLNVAIADGVSTANEASEHDNEWHVRHQIQKYGLHDYLPAWVIECGHSHATWVSASPYIDEKDDVYELLAAPRDESWGQAAVCAPFLLDAVVNLNYMLDGHPLTKRLRDVGVRAYALDSEVRTRRGLPIPERYSKPVLMDLP